MTNRITAVFEHGVFRPVTPVTLHEGARVELAFESEQPLKPPQAMLEAIEEIANLPLEGPEDGFPGAEHDRIVYGESEIEHRISSFEGGQTSAADWQDSVERARAKLNDNSR